MRRFIGWFCSIVVGLQVLAFVGLAVILAALYLLQESKPVLVHSDAPYVQGPSTFPQAAPSPWTPQPPPADGMPVVLPPAPHVTVTPPPMVAPLQPTPAVAPVAPQMPVPFATPAPTLSAPIAPPKTDESPKPEVSPKLEPPPSAEVAGIVESREENGSPLAGTVLASDPASEAKAFVETIQRLVEQEEAGHVASAAGESPHANVNDVAEPAPTPTSVKEAPAPAKELPGPAKEAIPLEVRLVDGTTAQVPKDLPLPDLEALTASLADASDRLYALADWHEKIYSFDRADTLREAARALRRERESIQFERPKPAYSLITPGAALLSGAEEEETLGLEPADQAEPADASEAANPVP